MEDGIALRASVLALPEELLFVFWTDDVTDPSPCDVRSPPAI